MLSLNYLREIHLTFLQKAQLVHIWMLFIKNRNEDVIRGQELSIECLQQSHKPKWFQQFAKNDELLQEYFERVFWVCHELGLLNLRYPFPLRGQVYRQSRLGKLLAWAPLCFTVTFFFFSWCFAKVAEPIKRFKQIHNIVTYASAFFIWWRHSEMSTVLIFLISVGIGVVSTWLATFLTDSEEY